MACSRCLSVFALFAFFALGMAALDCTYHDTESGFDYDLTALVVAPDAPASAFYSFSATTNEYYLNICEELNIEVLPCDIDSGSAVCQEELSNSSSFSCGEANTMIFSEYTGETSENNQGVQLTYQSGDYCYSLGTNRTTVINIGCNSKETAVIESVEEEFCLYTVQMWSMYGCESSDIPIPSESTSMSATPSSSVSVSFTPSPSVTLSLSYSAPSSSISVSTSHTVSRSGVTTVSNSASISASPPAAIESSSPSISQSSSMNGSFSSSISGSKAIASASTSPTTSKTNSVSSMASITPSISSMAPSDGTPAWIWYVMVAVVIAVLIGAALIAVLVIYQKKRQESSYSQLSFE